MAILRNVYDKMGRYLGQGYIPETAEEWAGAGVTMPVEIETEGAALDANNPLPTDSDSLYPKDVDISNSTTVGDGQDWTGDILLPFGNPSSGGITNATGDNPKIIDIAFERTVYANAVGLGCNTPVGFGNEIILRLIGSNDVVRKSITSTGDPNSRLIQFEEEEAFNKIRIEFNSATTVCVTNITARKVWANTVRMQGADKDGVLTTARVTQSGNQKVSIEEFDLPEGVGLPTSPILNLDAFERHRVSQTDQRIDVEFKYDLQPDIMTVVEVSGGTVAHNTLTKDASCKVNSVTDGAKAEFIQSWDNPYTPGNSQEVFMTGTPDKSGVNTLQASFYLRDAIRGQLIEVPQASWDFDASAMDWSKSQIFAMDFQSLKVGKIRFGFDMDGTYIQAGSIENDNRLAHGYWQDPNQPIVWRQFNTATETVVEIGYDDGVNGIGFRFTQAPNASAETIAICATVKSEGGGNLFDIEGINTGCDTGVSSVLVGTTPIPIISVRAKALFKGVTNKTIIIPNILNIHTDNDIHYYFVLDGTLTGASWQDVDTNRSGAEFDVTASAISGGSKILPDYLAVGPKNTTSGEASFLGKSVLSAARGTSNTITLVAVRTSATDAEVLAGISLKEIR